jgi:hypothetical protein
LHYQAQAQAFGHLEQDRMHFTPWQCSTLIDFLWHVDRIIKTVANVQAAKQLSTISNRMLLLIYLHWMKHELLPKDALANNKFTLLEAVDTWLADSV